MSDKEQIAASIAIIGSADGPTSIFIDGKAKKLSLKARIRKRIYQHRRKKAARRIVAGTHMLDELVLYAINTYGAVEARNKLGELPSVSRVYEIKAGGSCLDVEIDDAKETFGVSFSGNKKAMRHFQKIAKDLYVYYGVSENDIRNQTERYFSLLGVLSL